MGAKYPNFMDNIIKYLSELWELVMDREACGIHGVAKSRTRLSNWTDLIWSHFQKKKGMSIGVNQ